MKTLIYNKEQLEQMLKDNNFYSTGGRDKDYLHPYDIDFIKKQFPELPKESTLDQVTEAVKDIADFTIEETENKLIILTLIKK